MKTFIVILLGLFLFCFASGEECDRATAKLFPDRGAIHLATFSTLSYDSLRTMSNANVAIFQLFHLLSPDTNLVNRVNFLKSKNPNIKLIGYFTFLEDPLIISNPADSTWYRAHYPFLLDAHYIKYPNWAYSTTGDTVMIWQNQVLLNFCPEGRVDTLFMNKMLWLLSHYVSNSMVDGIFLDYFTIVLQKLANVEGDIDMDNDDVIWNNDTDERATYWKFQKEFLDNLSLVLPDKILIGNGFPARDSLFTKLNGYVCEDCSYAQTQKSDLEEITALVNACNNNKQIEGHIWSVLLASASYANRLPAISMLICVPYIDCTNGYIFSGWKLTPCDYMGEAIGLPYQEEEGGYVYWKRKYEKGTFYIKFFNGNWNGYGVEM